MLAGTGLFIGCIITGVESAIAADDLDTYCESGYYNTYYNTDYNTDNNTDNNRACEQLERIYNIVLALTVSYRI